MNMNASIDLTTENYLPDAAVEGASPTTHDAGAAPAPELEIIYNLINDSATCSAPISQFVELMTSRGYTHEGAIERMHHQICDGHIALTNMFEIVKR